jgi:hypothetical protein
MSNRCWLQRPRLGDIIVMDNLPTHKLAAFRQAIEATGAEL